MKKIVKKSVSEELLCCDWCGEPTYKGEYSIAEWHRDCVMAALKFALENSKPGKRPMLLKQCSGGCGKEFPTVQLSYGRCKACEKKHLDWLESINRSNGFEPITQVGS